MDFSIFLLNADYFLLINFTAQTQLLTYFALHSFSFEAHCSYVKTTYVNLEIKHCAAFSPTQG